MILAICDDCADDRTVIKKKLEQYLKNNHINAQLYTFQSGKEFLSHNGSPFDMYLWISFWMI